MDFEDERSKVRWDAHPSAYWNCVPDGCCQGIWGIETPRWPRDLYTNPARNPSQKYHTSTLTSTCQTKRMTTNRPPFSLCETCKSIVSSLENIRRLTVEDRLLIPFDLKTTIASRDHGCRFCQFIWDQVTNDRKIREQFEQNPGPCTRFHLSVKGGYDKQWDPANGWKEIPPEWADLKDLYVHAFFDDLNHWSRIETFDVYAERSE